MNSFCLECGTVFVPTKYTANGRQLFCSGRCRTRNWRKHNPSAYTLSRFQELQNYRLSRSNSTQVDVTDELAWGYVPK